MLHCDDDKAKRSHSTHFNFLQESDWITSFAWLHHFFHNLSTINVRSRFVKKEHRVSVLDQNSRGAASQGCSQDLCNLCCCCKWHLTWTLIRCLSLTAWVGCLGAGVSLHFRGQAALTWLTWLCLAWLTSQVLQPAQATKAPEATQALACLHEVQTNKNTSIIFNHY